LVNRTAVSIHHIVKPAPFLATAFIFNEDGARMVNHWCAPCPPQFCPNHAREPDVKLIALHQRIV
jgi:hypothetical protein